MKSSRRIRSLIGVGVAVAALLVGHAPSAMASDWNVVFNGRAVHLNASEEWNEENWGLGFEREFDVSSRWVPLVVGNGFIDSSREMSYMAGGGIKRRFSLQSIGSDLYVDLGMVGFVMTRTDYNNNQPFPGILPTLTVGSSRMALNVTYMPPVAVNRINQRDASLSGVVFLQLTMNPRLLLPNRTASW